MNILLINDDGFDAPGLEAAYNAVSELGTVHVVAPKTEQSACSHTITLKRSITVERVTHRQYGPIHVVEGTPADCVRLAAEVLLDTPLDLVVSGINRGANSGVDVFYSGTVAGAREGSILGIPAIAISQAVRATVNVDWPAASDVAAWLVRTLIQEALPGPGFWSINLPAPIPADARNHVHRVPASVVPAPGNFERVAREDGRVMEYKNATGYWVRSCAGPTDYTVIRDGGIAVSAIPLYGRF